MAAPFMPPEVRPNLPAGKLDEEIVRLYEEHATALSRYAASFAQNQEGARDAVQEVFLRYFIERRYGRIIGNPRAWLYHVLRNYMLDCHRRVNNREVIDENLDHLPSGQQNPERILQSSEIARELKSVLSEREFECLRLRAEGLDYAEICDVMGIRIGTVGALLSRVQKKIRRSAAENPIDAAGTAQAIDILFEKREAYS
ncbi:MAG TPA: sigma-70 family RNA polymerase sigma factor [Bryobacteraceae bacterium]|nr:sigma-70 family RNA polymerase sigma factor [Bryobacteraceae bacterium]